MKTRRIWFHTMAIALLCLLGSVMTASAQDDRKTAPGAASAQHDRDDDDHSRLRRDFLNGDWFFVKALNGQPIAAPGGTATASAEDGSTIILTGDGTFNLPSGRVTGGGTWRTLDPAGVVTGSGRYRVQSFISFNIATGLHPPGFGDTTGNIDDARAGLLQFTVDFLDGTEGVLAVSCHLSEHQEPRTEGTVFEGMHVTKGFSDYFKHATRTLEDSNTLIHIKFRR